MSKLRNFGCRGIQNFPYLMKNRLKIVQFCQILVTFRTSFGRKLKSIYLRTLNMLRFRCEKSISVPHSGRFKRLSQNFVIALFGLRIVQELIQTGKNKFSSISIATKMEKVTVNKYQMALSSSMMALLKMIYNRDNSETVGFYPPWPRQPLSQGAHTLKVLAY